MFFSPHSSLFLSHPSPLGYLYLFGIGFQFHENKILNTPCVGLHPISAYLPQITFDLPYLMLLCKSAFENIHMAGEIHQLAYYRRYNVIIFFGLFEAWELAMFKCALLKV